MLEGDGGSTRKKGRKGRKNWDKCNSIIIKMYFKKTRIPLNILDANIGNITTVQTNLCIRNKIFLKDDFSPSSPPPSDYSSRATCIMQWSPTVRVFMVSIQSTKGFFIPKVPGANCSTFQYVAHMLTVPFSLKSTFRSFFV